MQVSLPQLVEAEDYHDFHAFERNLRQLDPSFCCDEVGSITRQPIFESAYLGVVYIGEMPPKEELQKLVDNQDFGGVVDLS